MYTSLDHLLARSDLPVPTILVIDDSPEYCRMMELILQHAEFDVLIGRNGSEGLQKAIIHSPDLILLDYMMPDMNGGEVFHQLHENENTQHIPVIMITAFSADYQSDRMSALRDGVADYLTKPVSRDSLLERINSLLYLHRYSGSQ
jgi:DNA-binding response OmpR family regulator